MRRFLRDYGLPIAFFLAWLALGATDTPYHYGWGSL